MKVVELFVDELHKNQKMRDAFIAALEARGGSLVVGSIEVSPQPKKRVSLEREPEPDEILDVGSGYMRWVVTIQEDCEWCLSRDLRNGCPNWRRVSDSVGRNPSEFRLSTFRRQISQATNIINGPLDIDMDALHRSILSITPTNYPTRQFPFTHSNNAISYDPDFEYTIGLPEGDGWYWVSRRINDMHWAPISASVIENQRRDRSNYIFRRRRTIEFSFEHSNPHLHREDGYEYTIDIPDDLTGYECVLRNNPDRAWIPVNARAEQIRAELGGRIVLRRRIPAAPFIHNNTIFQYQPDLYEYTTETPMGYGWEWVFRDSNDSCWIDCGNLDEATRPAFAQRPRIYRKRR